MLPKKSLFSKDLKVNICSDSSMKHCDQAKVPKKLERKLQKCNFEGRLTNDPDSVVNLVGCIGDSLDISVMSSRVRNIKLNGWHRK